MLVNGDLRKYSQSRVPWHGMAFFQGSRELSSINRNHFFSENLSRHPRHKNPMYGERELEVDLRQYLS